MPLIAATTGPDITLVFVDDSLTGSINDYETCARVVLDGGIFF
jgi:hypothetical protein